MTETRAEKAQAWSDPLGYLQDASGSLVSIKSIAEVWAAIIEEATMTETRAEKAQRLVDGEHVHLTGRGTFFQNAMVYSGWDIYFVTLYTNGHFDCTCDHGSYHSHTDDLCTHALAVKLAVERMNET